MDISRIVYLHQRFLEGTLSPDENVEWEGVVHSPEGDAAIKSLMQATWASITPENQQSLAERRAQRVFDRVLRKPVARTFRLWLAAAAALLLVATAAWLLLQNGRVPTQPELRVDNFSPGGNRATLTLADGRTIALSEAQAGIVVANGITYLDGSQVMENEELKMKNERAVLNSITTPKGGTYQVTLPDGSKVWLNAASTLRYPSRFADGERRVEIDGEAYFSVAKDTHAPFVVWSRDQRVDVLGTEFNINAYADEPAVKTTLVEGAVQIVNQQSKLVKRLRPGEQSIVRGSDTEKQPVDVTEYVSWRDGRFNFEGKSLPEVMRELERWYDFRVAYEGRIPEIEFYGGIQRSRNLAMVMTLLETNGIRYRMQGDSTLVLAMARTTPAPTERRND